MKKLLLTFVGVLSLLLPTAALAVIATDNGGAVTYTWLDRQTIQFSDGTNSHNFFDGKIDGEGTGDYTYVEQGTISDGCADRIDTIRNNNTTGHLVSNIPNDHTTGCHQSSVSTIPLQSASNTNNKFVWVDPNTIVSADRIKTYTKNSNGTFDQKTSDGKCVDSIQTTSMADSGQLTIRVSAGKTYKSDGDASYNDAYWVGGPKPEVDKFNQNGCKIYKPLTVHFSPVETVQKDGATVPVGGTTPPAGDQSGADACAGASGPYAWILCPAVQKTDELLKSAYTGLVEPLLQIDPLNTDSTNTTYTVWKAFVSLANVLFVLAFLGIIFGTVLNLDAYTIKKALPRLVIAAIAVQISYFLCGIFIDISNIAGNGLLSFITDTVKFVPINSHASAGSNAIESTLSYGSAALIFGAFLYSAFLGPAVAIFVIGLAISVFTFVITLLIRKLLIITLIILAPIALVAWILPNTENLFKKWKDNFLKLLFIYPIMSVLVGSSYIVQAASRGDGKSAIGQIIGGIAPMIAFFMMPAVFKMSGQALGLASKGVGKVGNWGNQKGKDRAKGAYENSALLKARQERKLRENLATMSDPSKHGLTRRIAQRRAGFGFAQTAGAMAGGYSKLESIEKANESGATRQLSDVKASELSKLLNADVGDEVKLTSADGKSQRIVKVSEDHKTATIRMMASKARWDDLRDAKTTGKVTDSELSKGLAGTDSFAKARDLTLGAESALDSLNADSLVNMHHSTVRTLLDHVENMQPGAAKNEAREKLESAASTLLQTPNMRSKLSLESAQHLYYAAHGDPGSPGAPATPTTPAQPPRSARNAVFQPRPISGPPNSDDPIQIVDQNVNPNGTLKPKP